MSSYPKDEHGQYQVLREFVETGNGAGYCFICQVRRYEDNSIRLVTGPIVGVNDMPPEFRACLRIYAEAKNAMQSRLECPK